MELDQIDKLTKFGEEYLLLGLRVGKHIDGYVEAYYGPSHLAKVVSQEQKSSPQKLVQKSQLLLNTVSDQGFETKRQQYVQKSLYAMKTMAEILSGVEFDYLDKVQRLFDIHPTRANGSHLASIIDTLSSLYDGNGTLTERVETDRLTRTIAETEIKAAYDTGLQLVRKKTKALFANLLPQTEGIVTTTVQDTPWRAYNWYLGNYQSRIEINTTFPHEWDSVLGTSCHEGYPGHHTELSVKEKALYHTQGRFEHAILITHTPQLVISEGSAKMAVNVLFSSAKQRLETERAHLFPSSLELDFDLFLRRRTVLKEVGRAFGNTMIFQAHVDGLSDEELWNHVQDLGIPTTKERFQQRMPFFHHPMWSSYLFTYSEGAQLLRQKYGSHPTPTEFAHLLTSPILPSSLI